jgi:uncharacterized protein YPO0396
MQQDNIAYLTNYVEALEDFLRGDSISDKFAKRIINPSNITRHLIAEERQQLNIEIAAINERIAKIKKRQREKDMEEYGRQLWINPAVVK